jgi:endonuclease/exonuclease/phosphatase family metal-dependent hydrolase
MPDWSTMRLVTLNTWKGDGAYHRRLIAMTAGLRAENPDIVLLQECLRAPEARLDTAAYLAETLGMDHVAWHGRHKRRMVESQELDCTSGVAHTVSGADPGQPNHRAALGSRGW